MNATEIKNLAMAVAAQFEGSEAKALAVLSNKGGKTLTFAATAATNHAKSATALAMMDLEETRKGIFNKISLLDQQEKVTSYASWLEHEAKRILRNRKQELADEFVQKQNLDEIINLDGGKWSKLVDSLVMSNARYYDEAGEVQLRSYKLEHLEVEYFSPLYYELLIRQGGEYILLENFLKEDEEEILGRVIVARLKKKQIQRGNIKHYLVKVESAHATSTSMISEESKAVLKAKLWKSRNFTQEFGQIDSAVLHKQQEILEERHKLGNSVLK
jgi:hypothetical protein